MATYEDLKKANKAIKTLTLTRKDKKTGKETSKEYAEVNQRIKAFRMIYPDGFITTEIESLKDGECLMSAKVGEYTEDGSQHILGIGHAYEKQSDSFINQTSYVENCETSAVGRALGMAGFGIDTAVASYEEVQRAIETDRIDPTKANALMNMCERDGVSPEKIAEAFGVKSIYFLTEKMHSNVINHWADVKRRCSNE